MDNVKNILTAARAIVDAGWTQNSYMVKMGGAGLPTTRCFCLVGAVMQATHPGCLEVQDNNFDEAIHDPDTLAAMKAINEAVLRGTDGETVWSHAQVPITRWNDKEGRTKEEVLALLDEVIASIEENET